MPFSGNSAKQIVVKENKANTPVISFCFMLFFTSFGAEVPRFQQAGS